MTHRSEHCELWSAPADTLRQRYDANVCLFCLTLLWFAEILFEGGATENEIVPTLAFARHAEGLWSVSNPERRETAARQLVERYPALELVEVVGGVPVLQMKSAFAEITRYEGSSLAKGIRMRVLSRFAEPQAMAKLYWSICESEGRPRHQTSPGRISWAFDRMHLAVEIGPRDEIHPARLHQYAEHPRVRQFSFP